MIDYIGDISKQDAEVLANFAVTSNKILEFGCGASTQVLGYYTEGSLISIDTERVWLEKTAAHLARLKIDVGRVRLLPYDWFMSQETDSKWDLVFDDGADHMRRQFALEIWPYIEPNGWLLMHDQRRRPDWDTTAHIISHYWTEIGTVHYNYLDSNITCIQKREKPAIWTNWQIDENIDMKKW